MDYQLSGCRLHVIKTDKFKNTLISIKFKNELNRESTTIRSLLTMCLLGGTSKLRGQQELASYLENCYGANLASNITTKGKAQIIHLTSSFVNEKFLPTKEALLKKQVELMHDILFHPLFENGTFTNIVVSQKKRELKDRLSALKDDKYSYALDKTLDYMGKDDILGISGVGYEEDIDSITNEMLSKALSHMLSNDTIEIYVIGDIDEQQIDFIRNTFIFENRTNNYEAATTFISPRHSVQTFIEEQDITQSKFNMSYTTGVDFIHEDHEAMTIMNGVLGAFSHSRLFKNVREKHSLCYYISSSFDAFNGILLVTCGIEAKEAEHVQQLVTEQIRDMQEGNISDEEIQITKRMFENSLKKSQDEPGTIIGLKYNRDIVLKEETIEEYIEKLMAVTKEDIIRCANKLVLDTTFLLKGESQDEQETLSNN